jgi:fucose 4-O-acetylase-like acetyltransferase
MAYHGFEFAPQELLGGTHYTLPWSVQVVAVDLTYAFALPMFGFVTGLTLFYSRYSGWDLVKARARTLLVPYAAWLAVGAALLAVRTGIVAVPGYLVSGTVSAGASASLWYLYALFVCVCVFATCRSDRALIVTACIAPLVMAALAWEHVDVLEFRDAAWLYAPLVVGYLVAKYRPRHLALPALAVFALAFPFVAEVSPWALVFARLPIMPGELLYSVARVVGGIAGCLAVYEVRVPLAPLEWLGKRTLGIYALHSVVGQFAQARGVNSVWLAASLALIGSAALTLAIEQVPVARTFLLGQGSLRRRAP